MWKRHTGHSTDNRVFIRLRRCVADGHLFHQLTCALHVLRPGTGEWEDGACGDDTRRDTDGADEHGVQSGCGVCEGRSEAE